MPRGIDGPPFPKKPITPEDEDFYHTADAEAVPAEPVFTEDLKQLTKAEVRTKLKDTVGQLSKLAERTGLSDEKYELDQKEARYLDVYKKFYTDNNKLSRTFKTLRKSSDVAEIKALKSTYDESRLAYANKIAEKAREAAIQTASAPMNPEFVRRKTEEFNATILESGTDEQFADMQRKSPDYQAQLNEYLNKENAERRQKKIESIAAMARFHDVIKPAAEKKIEAREQALGEKGITQLERAAVSLKEWNSAQEEKYGKAGWRARKLMITTGIATVGAAATGVGLTTALLGFAGIKIGRSLVGMTAGTATGALSGKVANMFARRSQERANEKLPSLGKHLSLESVEDFVALDRERESTFAAAQERTVEKKTMIASALGAFLGGAGATSLFSLSDLLSHMPSVQHTIDSATSHGSHVTVPASPNHAPQEIPNHRVHESIGSVSHTAPSSELHETQAADAPRQTLIDGAKHEVNSSAEPAHTVERVEIKGHVNNADKLFEQFTAKLHEQYPDASKAPESVQKLFTIDGNRDHLTLALGLQDAHGNSIVMHKGDYVSLDGDKVMLHQVGKGSVDIVGAHGEVPKNISAESMVPVHHQHEAAVPQSEHIETAPNAHETQQSIPTELAHESHSTSISTRELNEQQIKSLSHSNLESTHGKYSFESLSLTPNTTINYDLLTNRPRIGNVPIDTQAFSHSPLDTMTKGDITITAHSELVNSRGLHINPAETHIYSLHKAEHTFLAYGDTEDKRIESAIAFLNDPKNFQKVIIVPGDQISSITHQPQSMIFTTDESGNIIHAANNLSDRGKILPPPSIDALVSIVK